MIIIEAFVFAMGIFGVGLAVLVGCGIAFSPITAFLFWKYPHLYESTRSMMYGGWVRHIDKDVSDELKELAEWAGFLEKGK